MFATFSGMGRVRRNVSSLNAHNSSDERCVIDRVDEETEAQRGYAGCLEGDHW